MAAGDPPAALSLSIFMVKESGFFDMPSASSNVLDTLKPVVHVISAQ